MRSLLASSTEKLEPEGSSLKSALSDSHGAKAATSDRCRLLSDFSLYIFDHRLLVTSDTHFTAELFKQFKSTFNNNMGQRLFSAPIHCRYSIEG